MGVAKVGNPPTEPFGFQSGNDRDGGQNGPSRRSVLRAPSAEPAAGSQDTAQAAEASEAAADDCLLHLRFAIIIAPGNLRPCRRGNYMPLFGLLLSDRTRMVCIWRKTAHCERGSGR
jgi:hypothetical protein